ncbi:MAG: GAF domain-containing protein [Flavobacteriaceae bacterium]|nr:MAG: GAF domain-containing protein [Flavobacteriaceae bacterium]
MIAPEDYHDEEGRLRELESYQIMDSEIEQDFDNLTKLAAEFVGTNISLVSLLDDERQWFKSRFGLDAEETPKELAFCGHAIQKPNEVFIVEDARRDERFHDNPLVTGEPYVIFYAGVPLISKNGFPLGTLCVIDDSPKELTEQQISMLKILSNQVMKLIELRKLNHELKSVYKEIGKKNKDLKNNYVKIQTLIKEIHHRVKNNMLMIANLLTFQEKEYDDPQILAALEQSKNRIQSMSLVHEKLYGSASLQDVKTHEYVNQLIAFIEDTLSSNVILPKKTIDIPEEIIFDSETMSAIGLILNELITNSYKYAFKPNEDNFLELSISKDKEVYTLVYSDSGPGLPNDFDIEFCDSLGMQLIHILTGQINGEITYTNDGKSTFRIKFKKAEPIVDS